MATKKSQSNQEEQEIPEVSASVISANIVSEMKESYLSYAMSVITSRALPDIRDGLKPVHRRILYSMYKMGITSGAKFTKSARIVGEVIGKYHPHGDSAVYDAMVNIAQDFSFRYPLILGQGNFGSIDGDAAAAMRYTEAKMSKIAGELLRDLEKETVAFRPNYDGAFQEPAVLPAAIPHLLLNGTLGIAVGMATNIPPHNLKEVIDATIHVIDNEDATVEDLVNFIQGPDFPTGGIIYNKKDILQAYATGRGGIVTRGEAEIVETKAGQSSIIITSLPYRVVKSNLILQIADLVRDKKIQGIKDLRDESTTDIRIVIDLKVGSFPQKVLNVIYKNTQLEQNFNFNLVALVDGIPQTLSLKDFLTEFIAHRKVVVTRRTEYDLRRAQEREHILLGLKKALDQIDAIITLIRESKDTGEAKLNLVKKFKFSEIQAQAILDMKLQRLAGLERKAILDELAEKQKLIAYLEGLLANPKLILGIIKDELTTISSLYSDDRRTKVMKGGVKSITEEDLIPDTDTVLVFTQGGYVKRTDPGEYRSQKRGGVGVIDLETKEEDVVTMLVTASTHSDLLFFSNRGKAYQIKMYEIPEGRRATKGKSIMNFLQLADDERITSIVAMNKKTKETSPYLMFVTRTGVAKKVSAESFKDVRRSGLIAISLQEGDELLSAQFVGKGDSMILVTQAGQSIRFKESDVREMGRSAAGIRGVKLGKNDVVVGAVVVRSDMKDVTILAIMSHGFGKRTHVEEYKLQKRGGSGIKTAKITAKTGELISAHAITDEVSELIVVSKKGQIIKTDLSSIPELGRQTQGVTIMKLREGDSIASISCL